MSHELLPKPSPKKIKRVLGAASLFLLLADVACSTQFSGKTMFDPAGGVLISPTGLHAELTVPRFLGHDYRTELDINYKSVSGPAGSEHCLDAGLVSGDMANPVGETATICTPPVPVNP